MLKRPTNQTYKFIVFGVLTVCTLAASLSCGIKSKTGGGDAQSESREVTDEAGRRIRVPIRIERVVSLAPNMTEIIFAVGAGNRLVGNTTFCDFPEAAKSVEKVGDTLQPNIERIIALRPQLVFVSTASQLEGFTRQMEAQNIPIYVTDPRDLNGVFRTITSVGDLLGEREKALQVVSELRTRAESIEAAVKSRTPVSVFYQVSREPLYTAGRDAYITDFIRRAGGRSVTADVPGAWPKYSDEAALASQPEAIIMASFDSMSKEVPKVADSLKNSPAAKNGRVYAINGDFLSRPGPRLINGLEEMARKLHPDAFN